MDGPAIPEARNLHGPVRIPLTTQDVMGYFGLQFTDQQSHYVLDLDGRLDEDRWAKAIRLVMDAEPVFGCRFVYDPKRPEWERRFDLDNIHLCQTVACTNLEHDLMSFLTFPTDPSVDPLVQARIFRGATDTICLKVSHIAADGLGIKELMYQIAAIYRGLEDPGFRPVINAEGSRSLSQILKHLTPREALWIVRRSGVMPPSRSGFPSNNRHTTSGRIIVRRRAEADRFDFIKSYGQSMAASLNDVLIAVFFRAAFIMVQPLHAPLTIMVPTNLRRYLPSAKAEAIANFSGAVFPRLEYIANEPFAGTLIRVRDWIRSARENGFGLGAALADESQEKTDFSKKLARVRLIRERDALVGCSTPALSNVGIIDPDLLDLGVPVVGAYAAGPVVYAPGMMLVVSSFRKVLTFTLGFCQSAMLRADVDRFLDLFMSELLAVGSVLN